VILYIDDRIRQKKVDYFNNLALSLRYDSVGSTFGFNFYYNPDNKEHKDLACVSHYHLARIEHNKKLIFTGFILSEKFKSTSVKELVGFAGYSVPGVLEDSNIPTDSYPLESLGLSLKQIAEKFVKPFQIKIDIDPAVESRMNKVFEKTTADATQSIKDYLVELASQRNIIVSHTAKGHLLFTEAKTNIPPILTFGEKLIGTNYDLDFNGQALHSHITVVKQADSEGGNAGEFTIRNPYVPYETTNTYRPKVIIQSSGDDIDTEQCAKNALAAELKNIKLTIVTDRWEDNNGDLILPNNMISVTSTELYLFKKTNWFIESVDYAGDNKQMIATLHCVLPEVYNGKFPSNIFTDH